MPTMKIYPDAHNTEKYTQHDDIYNDQDINAVLRSEPGIALVTIMDVEIQLSYVGERWYYNPSSITDSHGNPLVVFNAR